jgi:hypothetical protein
MTKIRAWLSYANVMSTIAVFVVLGGGAYAAKKLNGRDLVNRSVPAKKIKRNQLGPSEINEKRLAAKLPKVPSAKRADAATSATSATTASTATNATNATRATSAGSADSATTVGGFTAAQLRVSCPSGTTAHMGACMETSARSAATYSAAADVCRSSGRRLPTTSELVAYAVGVAALPSTEMSSDMTGVANNIDVTSVGGFASGSPADSTAYRCVASLSN